MSQFDRYTVPTYIDALRVFLAIGKRNFLREAGFVKQEVQKGRLTRKDYQEGPIAELEAKVNAKSARCEAPGSVVEGDGGTTMGERIRLARDYLGLTDSKVAEGLGVSRELVRRWGSDIHRPSKLDAVAAFLHVPLAWLEFGGQENLPANSHLGVRVGEESLHWRQQLYSLTQSVIGEIPEDADESYMQAYLEWTVFNREPMALAARRAGGRWHPVGGQLYFAPWVPIPEHGLARQDWSDEVEAIVQEELVNQRTTYGAWMAIKERCEALGLTEDDFPRRVSLHKRVQKERKRIEQFGVDLNGMVAASVEKYTKQ